MGCLIKHPGFSVLMIFHPTAVAGAFVIELVVLEDDRGFFARAFCEKEFAGQGIAMHTAQVNLSHNHHKGTLRGLHYQVEPSPEKKFVRCIRGAIWDVIIDMRPDSPTYLRHFGVELSAANRRALFVPEGCAHGYQALEDGAEVLYCVSASHSPAHERGIRHDDPRFGIQWPLPVTCISQKDRSWPDFQPV
jgi:dTDP-4-dehydrorhamnose 3,5-epimerase